MIRTAQAYWKIQTFKLRLDFQTFTLSARCPVRGIQTFKSGWLECLTPRCFTLFLPFQQPRCGEEGAHLQESLKASFALMKPAVLNPRGGFGSDNQRLQNTAQTFTDTSVHWDWGGAEVEDC